jgi:hypothetical protein
VPSVQSVLALLAAVACIESGCGDYPIPAHPLGALVNSLQPATVCFIHHPNTSATTAYTGPDGRTVAMTPEQCQQANADAQIAEQQQAAQEAQAEQQKRAAAAAQVIRNDESRGYKHVKVRDLVLDRKVYAANETKLSVSGFYHAQNRQNERLYDSYNEYMMHTLNPQAFGYVEALNVGLITEDGSRAMREYLLRCVAGCAVTILGHIGQCVETNAFGRRSEEVCLVAEDMRPVRN